MNAVVSNQGLFGLFELDSSGKVLYFKAIPDGDSTDTKTKVIGLNFFDEVAPFVNVEEFRRQFTWFVQSRGSVENFTFACHFEDGVVPTKVMMVRINERSEDGNTNLILVDIRRLNQCNSI